MALWWAVSGDTDQEPSLSVEDQLASFPWFVRAGPPHPMQVTRWGELTQTANHLGVIPVL